MGENITPASLLSLPNELLLKVSYLLSLEDQHSLLLTNCYLAGLIQHVPINTLFITHYSIRGRMTLYAFAAHNDYKGVKALLDRGILTFIVSPESIIQKAVKTQTTQTVCTLLNCGLNGDVPDELEIRPLFTAVMTGNVDMVQILLSKEEYGIDCNALGRLEEDSPEVVTPLMAATISGFLNIVLVLLRHARIDLNIATKYRGTALHHALYHHQRTILKVLLSDPRVDISSTNSNSDTPLQIAIRVEDIETVQFLLHDPRLHIHAPTLRETTLLHEAVMLQDSTILSILLKDERLDVNSSASTYYKITPLYDACSHSEEAVRVLLEDGRADINALNQFERTPLHAAVTNGKKYIVCLLLRDPRITTPLQNDQVRRALSIASISIPRDRDMIGILEEDCRRRREEERIERMKEDARRMNSTENRRYIF